MTGAARIAIASRSLKGLDILAALSFLASFPFTPIAQLSLGDWVGQQAADLFSSNCQLVASFGLGAHMHFTPPHLGGKRISKVGILKTGRISTVALTYLGSGAGMQLTHFMASSIDFTR